MLLRTCLSIWLSFAVSSWFVRAPSTRAGPASEARPLPLAESPSPREVAPKHKTDRVVLVTIDGLRWQEVFNGAEETLLTKENGGVHDVAATKKEFWHDTPEARREALMPFFWTVIAKQGQVFGNRAKESAVRVTNGLKFSYPGYNELLTGAPDERVDSNDKKANPNVSVLEWLNANSEFRDRVAAYCSWDCFPYILNVDRSKLFVNAGAMPVRGGMLTDRQRLLNDLIEQTTAPSDGVRHDSLTFYAALEHLKSRHPRVLYISFDQTDDFAHDGRYDLVLAETRQLDAFLRNLWETLQSTSDYRDKTTLIVTADHGRGDAPTEWKNHGKKTEGAEFIWIAAIGPDTPALGERTKTAPLTQSQIAATVAALLGEDYCAAMPKAAKPIEEIVSTGATSPR
jgi:Type I phosphodiesterase / nucleotide pyrophosphatase